MQEKKFIIFKYKNGKLGHKCGLFNHYELIQMNNIPICQVIEQGLLIEKTPIILECINTNHYLKAHNKRYDVLYSNRLTAFFQARQLNTLKQYNIDIKIDGD